MKINYKPIAFLAATVFSMLLPSTVWSVALIAPGDYALPGTTVADRPELAGLILEDKLFDYSFTDSNTGESVSGTVQNRVVKSNVDGTMDFYWRIRPNNPGTTPEGEITALRLFNGYGGWLLEADWRPDGLGTSSPDTAKYFSSGGINFLFEDNPVSYTNDQNNGSYFFFLDSQATAYSMTGTYDLLCNNSSGGNCISESFSAFAPAIPLPAAFWLFGSGLLGLIGCIKRR